MLRETIAASATMTTTKAATATSNHAGASRTSRTSSYGPTPTAALAARVCRSLSCRASASPSTCHGRKGAGRSG